MKVYTYSEARQKFSKVLDIARRALCPKMEGGLVVYTSLFYDSS